ncbi:hypothetical protein [Nodosilinea sp. LEGE 06152]|nr:hypothetical protein [Nodosilinea sp. LEGE 06152]
MAVNHRAAVGSQRRLYQTDGAPDGVSVVDEFERSATAGQTG